MRGWTKLFWPTEAGRAKTFFVRPKTKTWAEFTKTVVRYHQRSDWNHQRRIGSRPIHFNVKGWAEISVGGILSGPKSPAPPIYYGMILVRTIGLRTYLSPLWNWFYQNSLYQRMTKAGPLIGSSPTAYYKMSGPDHITSYRRYATPLTLSVPHTSTITVDDNMID